MAKHIEDIGKDAKDLLNEGYPIDGTVKFISQTNGLGFTQKATLHRYLKKDRTGVREIVTAAFEPKYEVKEHKVEFSGKLISNNNLSVGASARDLIGAGTKVDVTVNRSDRDGINAAVGVAYKSNSFAAKGKVTYPIVYDKKVIKINTEGVVHHSGSNSNLGLGTDVTVDSDAMKINTELVLSHTARDSQYKGSVRYDVFEASLGWGVSFWQKISDKNNWAVDISSEPSNRLLFTVGTEYKVDDDSTVKGKWQLIKNNDRVDYRVAGALRQKFSSHVTATLGADLNPRSFIGSTEGDANTFGLEVKFQD